MSYSVFFESKALKEFKKIDRANQTLIKEKILQLAANYDSLKNQLKPLKGKYDFLRLRVGNYRVVFQKDEDKLVIIIVRIGHRKAIYK